MFYKSNCYIYLEARAGIRFQEESQEQVLTLYKILFKVNLLGFTFCNVRNKHLLRYIFKTWIIIQAHIQNTDLEKLHVSLSNQWFSLIVIKISKRVANNKIIGKKASLQKSVILPKILGRCSDITSNSVKLPK